MKIFLPVQVSLLLITALLFTSEKIKAQNITIIESESYASWSINDSVWWHVAKGMGFNPKIVQYSALDNIDSLANTDVLIVSCAVINFTNNNQLQTIIDFIKSGKPAYLQAEYDTAYQGDSTFRVVMEALGEHFKWEGVVYNNYIPVTVLAPFSQYPDTVTYVNYFNYAQLGTGGPHIDTFIEYQGQYCGFYYHDSTSGNGPVISCTDEDWIWQEDRLPLMVNILYRLVYPNSASTGTTTVTANTFNTYPNPFSDYIAYSIPGDINRMDIINDLGQVVLTKIISGGNNQEHTIETNSLPPGLYILRAMGTSSIYVQKIIKE